MNRKQFVRKFPLAAKAALFFRYYLGRAYMHLCHAVHGIEKDKVFFTSFIGKTYNDSPRYLCETLLREHPDVKVVWQLKPDAPGRDRMPENIRTVAPHTLSALKEIATSHVIVENFNRPFYMPKFRDQWFLQIWHGDRGFKKVLYDMDPTIQCPEGKLIDLAVAGSDFGEKLYRTAFRYNGPVYNQGIPRNDILLRQDPEEIRRIRAALAIPKDAKVVLYAQTFRKDDIGGIAEAHIDLSAVTEKLREETRSDWVCLARCHLHNTGINVTGAQDVSRYPEMAELLLVSDLLITDYSSTAGDFILLDRPAILYQPDQKAFTETNRDFYFSLDDIPYACASSQNELLALLGELDSITVRSAAVRAFYGTHECGHATKDLVERIYKNLKT